MRILYLTHLTERTYPNYVTVLPVTSETITIKDHIQALSYLCDQPDSFAIVLCEPPISPNKPSSGENIDFSKIVSVVSHLSTNLPEGCSFVALSYSLKRAPSGSLIWSGRLPRKMNLISMSPLITHITCYYIGKSFAQESLEAQSYSSLDEIAAKSRGLIAYPPLNAESYMNKSELKFLSLLTTFSSLADRLPAIYCINLKSSVDRRERMEHRFKVAGLTSHVTFVEAVPWTDSVIADNFPSVDLPEPEIKHHMCVMGCMLSHYKALQMFIESGDDEAIICEDDVMLHDDFACRYLTLFDNVPAKTSLVMLGWTAGSLYGFKWAGRDPQRKNLARILPDRTWGTIMYWISRDYAIKAREYFYSISPLIRKDKKISCSRGLIDGHSSEDITRYSRGYIAIPPLALSDCLDTTLRHNLPDQTDVFNLFKPWGFKDYLRGERGDVSRYLEASSGTPPLDALLEMPQNRTLVTVVSSSKDKISKKLLSLEENIIVFIFSKKKKLERKRDSSRTRFIFYPGSEKKKTKYELLYDALMFNPFSSTHFAWIDATYPLLMKELPSTFDDRIRYQRVGDESFFTGSHSSLIQLCRYLLFQKKSLSEVMSFHSDIFGSPWIDTRHYINHLREKELNEEALKVLFELKETSFWYYEELLTLLSKQLQSETLKEQYQTVAQEFFDLLISRRDFLKELMTSFHRVAPLFEQCEEPPGRRVAIVCTYDQRLLPWDPFTVTTGLTGSEEAVVYLGMELANFNCRVDIYAMPPRYSPWRLKIANPRYYDAFMPLSDGYDIIIVWRYPQLIPRVIPHGTTILLWPHDILSQAHPELKGLDGVLWLSQYQRQQYCRVDPQFSSYPNIIYGNGIPVPFRESESELYRTPRPPRSCIYGSNYGRGLSILLEIWPTIFERFPDVTLDIYYGANTWGTLSKEKEAKILKRIADLQPFGVREHGLVGHEELMMAYARSSFWLYPCIIPEVYCITALRAQYAGCIPVICRGEALNETVHPEAPSVNRSTSDIMCLVQNIDTLTSTTGQLPSFIQEYKDLLLRTLERAETITEKEREKYYLFAKDKTWESVAEKVLSNYASFDLVGYVVSSDGTSDRWSHLSSQIKWEWPPIERFPVVDENSTKERPDVASHLNLWKQLVNDTDIDTYLILPDNIIFCTNFSGKLRTILSELVLVSWDLLFLGGHTSDSSNNETSDDLKASRYSIILMSSTETSLSSETSRNEHISGYIITKEGARKLLRRAKKGIESTFDQWLLEQLPHLTVYVIEPSLVQRISVPDSPSKDETVKNVSTDN